MGRSNRNARSRSQGRRIHVNKYIGQIGRTKVKKPNRTKVRADRCQSSIPAARDSFGGGYSYRAGAGRSPKRYEVWFADLGDQPGTSVPSGNRPVLVISNDVGNQYSRTVTVIPLTTKLKRMDMPTHIILTEDDCCLFRPHTLQNSVLLAEQITPIAKSALYDRVCRVISKKKRQEIEQAIAVQLDMQRSHDICECDSTDTSQEADISHEADTSFSADAHDHKEEPAW